MLSAQRTCHCVTTPRHLHFGHPTPSSSSIFSRGPDYLCVVDARFSRASRRRRPRPGAVSDSQQCDILCPRLNSELEVEIGSEAKLGGFRYAIVRWLQMQHLLDANKSPAERLAPQEVEAVHVSRPKNDCTSPGAARHHCPSSSRGPPAIAIWQCNVVLGGGIVAAICQRQQRHRW